MSSIKRKKKSKDIVIGAPTAFQSGIKVTRDHDTGELKGLPSAVTEEGILGKTSKFARSSSKKIDGSSSQLPEVLRVTGHAEMMKQAEERKKKEEEMARREVEKKKKEKQNASQQAPKMTITGPVRVTHKLHVDQDLKWTGDDSATSVRLETKLGEGAFGCVYKATHLATEQTVAIKTVKGATAEGGLEGLDEIKKEIEILKACRHPNIVSMYGCVEHEGELWILMDYCGVGSVKDWMKKSKATLAEEQVAALMHYVLQGLTYLHEENIIHRDLKSANILVSEAGDVKIADFGVSFNIKDSVSKAKTVVGTPLFMSPESLDAGDYGEAADIWSLGITAIEMMEGQPPYSEEIVMRAMLLIATSDPPQLSNKEAVSEQCNAFIARCLQKNPADRPSAKELLDDPFLLEKNHAAIMKQWIAEVKILQMAEEAETQRVVQDERLERERAKEREREREREEQERNDEKESNVILSPKSRRSNNGDDNGENMELGRIQALCDIEKELRFKLRALQEFQGQIELYSNMSFKQLSEEINSMRQEVPKLEKKLEKLKKRKC